jgi:hypothetical protein
MAGVEGDHAAVIAEPHHRAVADGLAPVIVPKGTVVMYSAAPGAVARDGDRPVFVNELLKEIRGPGRIEEVFNRTLVGVSRASQGEQVPWFSSSLVEDFSFGTSAGATPAREGKDYPPSQAGNVDPVKPLLTYSRPKGEYKGADADPIMIDFWLLNAKLQGDGGEYRVRYSVDDGEAKFLEKWEPIWLSGWVSGKHRVKVELVDKAGNVVDNGGYNSTTREITVTK